MQTRFQSVEDRYVNDVRYRQLVDMLESCIAEMHLTPSEVREAALLACIRFEQHRKPMEIRVETVKELLGWLADVEYRRRRAYG